MATITAKGMRYGMAITDPNKFIENLSKLDASAIGGASSRQIITFLAGGVAGNGFASGDDVQQGGGLIAALVMLAWSIWQKKKAAKATAAAAAVAAEPKTGPQTPQTTPPPMAPVQKR